MADAPAPVRADLAVVGGGLTGCLAALAAAARGAKVTLCSRSWGASAQWRGALQLAHSAAVADGAPLSEHVRAIARVRASHPFAQLGAPRAHSGITEGLRLLEGALTRAGLGLHAAPEHAPAAYLLPGGGQLWAGAALTTHAPFDGAAAAAPERPDGIVCMRDRSEDCAPAGLRRLPPLPAWALGVAGARALDDAAAVEALIAHLRPQVGGLTRLWLPAVLGLAKSAAAHARLQEGLNLQIHELLGEVAPSVPGLRLMPALDAALAAAGVRRLGAVASIDLAPTPKLHLVDGARLEAGALVLATGRLLGGGLPAGAAAAEPLLGLDLLPPEAGQGWGARVAAAGIACDAQLQARRAQAPVAHVRVAGMGLAGHAGGMDGCADGVALCTAVWAARLALGDKEA